MLSRIHIYSVLGLLMLLLFATPVVLASNTRNAERIPDSVVSLTSGYVVNVDKRHQKIYVFKKEDTFSKVFEANCSTGRNQGGKQVSGDAKTPQGIFFATRVLSNPGPPETYGTLAFPLDYPTVMDKKVGRNGTNIWIHGTIKPLTPFQSNGCVVLTDKDIHALSRFIQVNKTPIIIAETISWVPQNAALPARSELGNVLASWTRGYSDGDIKAIDALYLEGNKIRGKKREALLSRLSALRGFNQHFYLAPKDVSILQQASNAVILFDQITDIKRDNSFEGTFNRLSLEKINNRWFIIDDVDENTADLKPASQTADAEAVSSLSSKAVRQKVMKWAESWESGNMTSYRSCYVPGFRAQGMDLSAWVDHKTAVRERSRNIRVRISNLHISGDNNQSTAVFTQHYSSNLLKSKGRKRLDLKKVNGEWKIYREVML